MKTVKVKNIEIGADKPKICVPIVGETIEDIIEEAISFKGKSIDIIEWRVDGFEKVYIHEEVLHVLEQLLKIIPDIPLLFTFRTANEGGKKAISPDKYVSLNKEVIKSGYVDLVDVELYIGDRYAREIISCAHEHNVFVIASNHDFEKTPDKQEMKNRLLRMQTMEADIAKIAVMPKSKLDVLYLLEVTATIQEDGLHIPCITMSMAGLGVVSRIVGEIFGSAVTFGAVNKTSAPGQIRVKELENILEILHNNL